jgi:ribosomal protein S18 acetylase RimI-like enzyme
MGAGGEVHVRGVALRRLAPGDAASLAAFYNGLREASKRTFRPLGITTTVAACEGILAANAGVCPANYDLVAAEGVEIVGWSFLWGLEVLRLIPACGVAHCGEGAAGGERPVFGLAVADAYQGQGLGKALITQVMAWAREQEIPEVFLTVVQDNAIAWHLYEEMGFIRYGEFVGDDGLPYYRMRADLGQIARSRG